MDILPYRPDMVAGVVESYNRTFRDVPLCYPVNVQNFAAAVASGESLRPGAPLHSLAASVATDSGAVVGFVQTGVRPPEQDGGSEQGMIRFLWYEAGRRAAGQALLEAAEAHLRRHGLERVEAFHHYYTYPFCQMRPCYLSDRLGHVQALLLFNGYQRFAGEVLLLWPDFEPLEPAPMSARPELAVQWERTTGRRPALILRAVQDGRRVGECECVRVGDYTDDERARDWFFTMWLGVAEEFQGQGLGRHLLRRACLEMRGAGYRHAAISTADYNHRAFLFYTNFGYRVADWTHGFARRLA